MNGVAVVTGADRGLGLEITRKFLERGWKVFSGKYLANWQELQTLKSSYGNLLEIFDLDVASDESVIAFFDQVNSKTDTVDILVNNAGIRTEIDKFDDSINYETIEKAFSVNSVGPLRMVKAFLPLLDISKTKRLCFISSEAGTISNTTRVNNFGYCMTKAALNMNIRILNNCLLHEGYSFRVYHPGWLRSYMGGTKNLEADIEPEDSAEVAVTYFTDNSKTDNRLVLIDYLGRELPF